MDHTCIGKQKIAACLHTLNMALSVALNFRCTYVSPAFRSSDLCAALTLPASTTQPASLLSAADCDTCRYMAPDFFKRKNMQSAVLRQPETEEERIEAFRALLSCPT